MKAFEDYQSQLESGQQKAKELNRRFAKWYYVISGKSYDALALKRDSLVSAKASESESSEAAPPDADSDSASGGTSAEAKNQSDSVSGSDFNSNELGSN